MGPAPTRITGPAFPRAATKKSWAQPAAWAGKGKKGRKRGLAGLWLLGRFAGYQAEGERKRGDLGPREEGFVFIILFSFSFIPKLFSNLF
jgi:hypothetical protein